MRVLQLIDSLEAGGAERMAVNLANALIDQVDGSYLCATRAEGLLKASIDPSVSYTFLKKRSTFDLIAFYRLYKFVKSEKISIIHAHSSSFFLGTLVKLVHPKVKLIWHDHYGNSELLNQRPFKVLSLCSGWFDLVFCVNTKLVTWNRTHLKSPRIQFLTNFVIPSNTIEKVTNLKGDEGTRMLCLANLRSQKDQLTLLKAFKETHELYPDWTLHLVGKDFEDAYSDTIKHYIKTKHLEASVFLYGSKTDTDAIMSQCEIGVLSSLSEGLPLALIEYGFNGLATIATDVGDCKRVLNKDTLGQLVKPSDIEVLSVAMNHYIADKGKRKTAGNNLRIYVQQHFSKQAIIETLLLNYKHVLSH